MPADVVANSMITDAQLEEHVQAAVGALVVVPVNLHTVDTGSETMEGTRTVGRTVVPAEFESKDDVHTRHTSPEDPAAIGMRLSSTEGFRVLVHGGA